MNLATIAVRNMIRNRFRTILTILGVAVAIVAFVLLRTVLWAWTYGAEVAAKDRIGTRHKVSFIIPLPKRYVDTVRNVNGVRGATWANWFGAKDPRRPNEFFPSMAVDPESFLEVYDEVKVTNDVRQRWLQDRQGAVIGDVLARKMGWNPGDRVTLQGTIYPGDWTFHIIGTYTATRKSIDRSEFLFHWNYMNDSLPARDRDKVGWIVSRIDDPRSTASIARSIDRIFDTQDVQTLSMSEGAMNQSFIAMFSQLLSALNIISVIILVILLMILGNTIAMGVRERTGEYGTLRALGFLPKHIAGFIFGESALLGFVAGAVGLLLAYPIVQLGMGRFIEENMGSYFPYFRIPVTTAILALAYATALGAAAGLIPAIRASRLTVTNALRRVE